MKKLNVLLFTSALLAVCANAGFENFEGGTENEPFANWEGDGYITNAVLTYTYGVPGNQDEGANTLALAIEGSVTNASLFTSGTSQVDMMVKVVYPDEALALPSGETDVQIAVGVNTNGVLNVYCAPKTGSGTAAFVPVSAALTAGDWKRISFNFDYSTGFCEVVLDGLPCVSEYGALSPDTTGVAGAWYKLAKDNASTLSSMKVVGTTAIDCVYTGTGSTPIPFDGTVADSTTGANVPRSWLAEQGLADPSANAPDSATTGMTVAQKYIAGLDVNDGIKFELKDMQPSSSNADKMVFSFPGVGTSSNYKIMGCTTVNGTYTDMGGDFTAGESGANNTIAIDIDDITSGVKYFKLQAIR